MAMLPKLKLKALVSFPSNVYGGTGIDVVKTNGNFTINLDYSEFPTTGTLPPNTSAVVWDSVTDTYYLVPPSSVGGISDAPSDSLMYGRINRAWVDAWASPVLTGNPTAPTPTVGDNDTSIATTAFVASAVSTVTITGGVTYTPQSPTVSQQTIARQNIYAAPFDALAYNGMQINSGMEVSQENGVGTVSASGAHIVDGYKIQMVGVHTLVAQQVPAGNSPPGFSNSIQFYVGTPNNAPASGDYALIRTNIEGYRAARLGWGAAGASPITLSFWAFSILAGTYSGSVFNAGFNRSYPFTFTLGANTWEYKTITIPGDTTGTWDKTNGVGIGISFAALAFGSIAGPANAWAGVGYLGATGSSNGVATGGLFRLTGVVVLPGIEAPSAARSPLIMRPYDQELLTCQRYWEKGQLGWDGYALSATYASTTVYFKAVKQAPPTVLTVNVSASSFPSTASAVDASTPGPLLGFKAYRQANGTGGANFTDTWTANARL